MSIEIVYAQNNLVLNSSFEENIICPNNLANSVNNYNVLSASNPAGYSPDYFNICDQSPLNTYNIPSNGIGY